MNRNVFLGVLVAVVTSSLARGQNYSWNQYSGGNWSVAGNWLPNSGFSPTIDSILLFGSNQTAQTTNSYTSTFNNIYDVNGLTFTSTPGITTTLSGGTAGSTIRFNQSSTSAQPVLALNGSGPVVIANGSATAGVTLAGSGTRLQITGTTFSRLTLSANIVETGGSNGIDINRGSAGTFGNSTGLTILSGNNTFTGGVRLQAGNLVVESNTALGTGQFVVDGANSSVRFNSSLTIANSILLNQTMTVLGGDDLSNNGATINGSVTGNGGLTFRPSGSFVQMTFTNANTFSGPVTLAPVGLSAAYVTVNGNGTMSNASAYNLAGNVNFTFGALTGPATGRINPNAVLTMNSANANYNGNQTVASSETFRRLEISGNSSIGISSAGGGETKLTFTEGLVRQPGATIQFSAFNMASTAPNLPTNYYFGTAPTGAIGGGGGEGTTTRSIYPYATSYSIDGTLSVIGGVVTWNAALGRVEPLKTNEFASNLSTTGSSAPNANIRITQTSTLPQTGMVTNLYNPTTINSLFLTSYSTSLAPPGPSPWRETLVGPSVAGTASLTVQSGMVQVGSFGNANVSTPSLINVGSVNFGSNTGYLFGRGLMNSPMAGSNGVVVAGTWTLSSLSHSFTGDLFVNGQVNVANPGNVGSAATVIRLNGGSLSFSPETYFGTGLQSTLTLPNPIVLATEGGVVSSSSSGGSFTASGNSKFTLAGPISGVGMLSYSTFGIVALTNTSNSYSGGTTINGGVLQVTGDGSLGAAGSVVILRGGTLEPLNSFSTSRPFQLVDQGSGRANSIFTNGQNLTLDGVITGSTANTAQSPLVKIGPGTLTLTATSPFVGPVIVGDGRDGFDRWISRVFPSSGTGAQVAGTLALSGANGALPQVNLIFLDGQMHLDNTAAVNNQRIGVVPMRVNGGELKVTGNATADVNQWIGAVQGGDWAGSPLPGTITLDQSGGSNRLTSVTALNLNTLAQSMLFLRGTNLGGATGNRTQIIASNLPTTVNGMLPSMVGATTANGSPSEFLTTVAAGSQFEIKPFTAYAGNLPTSVGNSTSTYDQTTAVTMTGNAFANAIRMQAGSSINLAGQTLTVGGSAQAGAILAVPGANPQIVGGTLAFGTNPARLTVTDELTLGVTGQTISLSGTGGLVKFGAGQLRINGNNSIVDSGSNFDLVIGQGSVKLDSSGALPAGARVFMGQGAILDAGSNDVSLTDLRGYGMVQGNANIILSGSFNALQAYAGGFSGTGTLRLPIANSQVFTLNGSSPGFSGNVEFLSGGVNVNGPNVLGSGTSPIVVGSASNTNGFSLTFGPAVSNVTRDITVNGPVGGSARFVIFNAMYANYSGNLILNAANTFLYNGQGGQGTVLNMNGNISGPGLLTIGSNNSHINLNGNNTYTGGTSVSLERNQVLGIGTNSPFGTGTVTFAGNQTGYHGYFRADNGNRAIPNNMVLSLTSFGVTGPNDLRFNGTITPPNNNTFGLSFVVLGSGRMVFGNTIAAAGTTALHKMGPGTLVLDAPGGSPSLASPWNVWGGTLTATNTSGSATGTSTVRVFNGGVLSGSGRITGATTIETGGTIRGGATETSTETLTLTSNLTLASGSTIQMNVNNLTASRIIAPNVLTSSTVTLILRDTGLIMNQAYSYEVIRTTGTTAFNLSHFAVSADFATSSLTLTQTSSPSVLYVNFVPVPEPMSLLAFAAAGGLLLRRVVTRRRADSTTTTIS